MASCGRHVLDRLNEDSTGDREPGKTCGKCGAMKQVCQGEFTLIHHSVTCSLAGKFCGKTFGVCFWVACILQKKVAHDLQKHAPNLLPYW